MSLFIDLQYIQRMSMYVDMLTKKGDYIYNCRCPICGDSKKNLSKKRGFFFQKKGNMFFKCHNCDVCYSLSNFIKIIAPTIHKEYCMEKFKDSSPSNDIQVKPTRFKRKKPKIKLDIPSISQLNIGHIAKSYVLNRKIPYEFHNKIFYADNFKECALRFDAEQTNLANEKRLVIPFYDKTGEIFAIQGRLLEKDSEYKLKYITIRLDKDEETKKPYGLERFNPNIKTYLIEGPIDSMFLPNCLAIGSSNIVSHSGNTYASQLNKDITTIIFDNECRNKEIVAKMMLAIKQGYTICIWPENIKQKDINEMILNGYTPSKLQWIIDSNSFSGLEAQLVINKWKRI